MDLSTKEPADLLRRRYFLADHLQGATAMIRKLRNLSKFPEIVIKALSDETDEVEVPECKARSPVYTGKIGSGYPVPGVLRDSIHQEGPFQDGRRIYTEIVAGGRASAYAIVQHERLDFFHKVGQAKYIESVVMESRPYMAARVAKRIDFSSIL